MRGALLLEEYTGSLRDRSYWLSGKESVLVHSQTEGRQCGCAASSILDIDWKRPRPSPWSFYHYRLPVERTIPCYLYTQPEIQQTLLSWDSWNDNQVKGNPY
ncbi:hypothetical protein Y032_0135g1945 [Ancylostoma ceylanicum]|uniref:Uncharacterized protein n=1 Tax=Ancylostoma ceylanicum TaxID=53326 RepID=A0A016T5X5_9BILA|nr:hypothetical protein Y032_0135g1945 [Ancylostoma ceylanicum]